MLIPFLFIVFVIEVQRRWAPAVYPDVAATRIEVGENLTEKEMAMEYVTVTYPGSRKVFIDGEEAGFTNTLLRVDEGTHTFSLGNPKDYKPDSIKRQVTGTTSVKPMEVTFEKI